MTVRLRVCGLFIDKCVPHKRMLVFEHRVCVFKIKRGDDQAGVSILPVSTLLPDRRPGVEVSL